MSQLASELNEVAFQTPSNEVSSPELSIVMPCLNESETLALCISKAQRWLREQKVSGEIIVADNGSTDGSPTIARRMNTRVIRVEAQGYGNALMGGITAARGRYIIMGDADDSYDFTNLTPFIEKLRKGYDLVMGNRFKGEVKPGAMPVLNRYIGNPVLTAIGRLFFKAPCGDFHCGLRGFSKDAALRMNLQTTGMEFATEMVVKATLNGLRITEVSTTLSPDGRGRAPHLRPWRDGWRHLRFLLLYSPSWLFLYPGIVLMLTGLLTGLWLLPGPRVVGSVTFDVHTLLYSAGAVFVGFQSTLFAAFTKIFAVTERLHPLDSRLDRLFRIFTLEKGLILGGTLIIIGLVGSVYALSDWGMRSFGALDPVLTLRIVIPAVLSLTLGIQTILSSFFLSILGMRWK
jgi:glycosyltransferase involved in cell wall biosynthesis